MANSTILNLLTTNNPIFRAYVFWGLILILKMLAMALLTEWHRFQQKEKRRNSIERHVTFADQENAAIERVRRSHRNDLENILTLLFIEFFYILTNPHPKHTISLFQWAAIFRLLHTVVYSIFVMPQPSRFISFIIPFMLSIYMAINVVWRTM